MIKYSDNGCSFDGTETIEEFIAACQKIATDEREEPIQCGDILNTCKERYGEAWTQAASYWPVNKRHTLQNRMSVCASVPKRVRPVGVRFSQMRVVAPFPEKEQQEYLLLAVEKDYGGEELADVIRVACGIDPQINEAEKLRERLLTIMDKLMVLKPSWKGFLQLAADTIRDAK